MFVHGPGWRGTCCCSSWYFVIIRGGGVVSSAYPGLETQLDGCALAGEREGGGPATRDLFAYLQGVMSDLRAPIAPSDAHVEPTAVATGVVGLLFSRPSSYL